MPYTVQCQWYFQKSKLLQKLPLNVNSYTALVIWHLASPTAEQRVKSDGFPYTWGDYTEKIVSIVLARHVSATTIICVNDPYDNAESIKDDEHQLRIQGQGPIPNMYMKPANLFPTNCKFKTNLCSSGNKERLQALIKTQLSDSALRAITFHQSGIGLLSEWALCEPVNWRYQGQLELQLG